MLFISSSGPCGGRVRLLSCSGRHTTTRLYRRSKAHVSSMVMNGDERKGKKKKSRNFQFEKQNSLPLSRTRSQPQFANWKMSTSFNTNSSFYVVIWISQLPSSFFNSFFSSNDGETEVGNKLAITRWTVWMEDRERDREKGRRAIKERKDEAQT